MNTCSKNEILAALSKLKEVAQQNRDAVAMNQVGIYYGRLHEHDEADRCYSLEKEIRSKTPPPPIITPPVKTDGEPIPGTNLTWRLDDNGTLTISGKGDMKDWDNEKNPAPWYGQRAAIKKVMIEDGVTSIGDAAFYCCELLTSVVIPHSVTSIGDVAFYCCELLTSVVIPDSVTSIGTGAFSNCNSLTSVTLPDNVFMNRAVFVGCTSLKKIYQPSNFIFCDDLFVYKRQSEGLSINSFIGTTPTVVIPNSVTSIDYEAFALCVSLKSVVIPHSVTFIGGYAFEGCESLANVTLPDNITTFGEAVFVGCTSLKKIDQPSKVIFCDNSFVYEKAPEGIRINSFIGMTPTVAIPRSVTSIGKSAFEFCESLTNITIPPNITKILGNIFYGCSNLKTIRYTKIYKNRMEVLKRKLSTGNNAELILY